MFVQLKNANPVEFLTQLRKGLSSILLCEGTDDVKKIKRVASKLKIELKSVGITDCGGIPSIYDIATDVVVLSRNSRNLRAIAVIIDADEYSYERRKESFFGSLRNKGADITNVERLEETKSLYHGEIGIGRRKIALYVLIAGLMNLPFQKHAIEDYLVQILLKKGKLKPKDLKREAKGVMINFSEDPTGIIDNAEFEIVEECFADLKLLLQSLDEELSSRNKNNMYRA